MLSKRHTLFSENKDQLCLDQQMKSLLSLRPSLVPDLWIGPVLSILCNTVQPGKNSHKSLRGCRVKTMTTVEHRQALSLSRLDHGKPTTCSFVISRSGHCNCLVLFQEGCLYFSLFFYNTVGEYNQPALAWRKTTSRSVLWEGILSDWSTKYKRIFKLPTRLLWLMLQKQWNSLTKHCVRLCLLWVFFFHESRNQLSLARDTI